MFDDYTGPQKAAIVLIGLGAEKAAKVFKHLNEDEIEQVVGIMSEMQEVTSDVSEQVMEEAYVEVAEGRTSSVGGLNYTKQVNLAGGIQLDGQEKEW